MIVEGRYHLSFKTELRDVYLDVAKQPTKAPFFLFGRLVNVEEYSVAVCGKSAVRYKIAYSI
mgnify:CR=1 FL=1